MNEKAKVLYNETLFRNSFYIMFSTGTMAVFGFLFWLLVAHLYQPSQVGIASTLVSSMIFISYLSLLGFNSTIVRFLPLSKSRNAQINTSFVLVTLGALLVSGLFVIFAPEFAPKLALLHQHIWYGLAFVMLCVGATLNLVTDAIFIAYRSAGYNLLIDGLFGGSIQLALPVAFLALGTYGIYAAQGLSTFIIMVISIIFLAKKYQYRPRVEINKTILKNVLHYSTWSYIASLLSIVPTIILPIIILNKIGAAPAGYYYLAFMMANVLFSIAYAVSQSLFAEGSYGERKLMTLIRRATLFLAAIIIPASIILALLGPFVLSFFGKTYGLHSKEVIIVLAAAGPFVAANALGTVILSITKQMKTLAVASLLYAAIVCSSALLFAHRGLAWIGSSWLLGNALTALFVFIVIAVRHRRSAIIEQSSVQTPA